MDERTDKSEPPVDSPGERRVSALARIVSKLRGEPGDMSVMLTFDEVVDALGWRGVIDAGVQSIPVDSIVGTVSRDPKESASVARKTTNQSARVRAIARARARGETLPPIEVYRLGELHFVSDGHHRVAIARARGERAIEAHVRAVRTSIGAARGLRAEDLSLKHHERVFHERVPLPAPLRERIKFSDEWKYAFLALEVEAWAFRLSHAEGRLLSREEAAQVWFSDEYEPVVGALLEVDIGGHGTEADRYLRVAILRYLLLYTHDWSAQVVERLLRELGRDSPSVDDTMVHRMLDEME